MAEKSTDELEQVLSTTHPKEITHFLDDEKDNLLQEDRPFSNYMRSKFKEKKLKQQDIFINANVPEGYGYKLISGEKITRQRDVILRLCYASRFTLEETQKALRIYGMPELYARSQRDAVLMIIFNEKPRNVSDVDEILAANGMETLRPIGTQE